MAELKTKKTDDDVDKFLDGIADPVRQADARVVNRLMTEATGESPAMWGSSIVGFGQYHYRYASGREGTWLKIGFSPRKANLTIYLMEGFADHQDLLQKLGPGTSTAKACLYIKSLADVDQTVLKELIRRSYHHGEPMGSA